MRKTTALSLLAAMCITLSACSVNNGNTDTSSSDESFGPVAASGTDEENDEAPAESGGITELTAVSVQEFRFSASEMFTARDYEIGYSDCTEISLSDDGSSVSGSGASVDGNVITITAGGSYVLTGTLSNGQIVVDADGEKVQLVLKYASVTSSGSAAIYVKNADKVFVTTAAGSSNTFASTGEFVRSDDSNIDGAVFAKSDVTFNGAGSLEISSETAHGIVCKDDLKFMSGSYTVTAAKKGIDCNESVRTAGGTITINSGTDGIHAENSDKVEKAFVFIGGGEITVTSGNDAIDASGEIYASDGKITILSDGGAENAPAHSDNDFGMRWDRDNASTENGTQTESGKGIKSDSTITVAGGTFIIDSSDDTIHSGTSVIMTGGDITASSGDDGIHADDSVLVSGGTVSITRSYEGIEGEVIQISGGNITVRASDDGMNAAGGSDSTESGFGFGRGGMMDTDENARLEISGGLIKVNADGDGLDSNGYLVVSGGTIYVSGPTNSGNGALDSGISATITGGYIIAAGSVGMAENFGSDSTQGSILYTFDSDIAAGTDISLLDADGKTLVSYAPEKQFRCAVISTPDVAAGSTYTLNVGDNSYTVEMTSNIYGESNGFGGFGGGWNGWNNDGSDFGGRGGRSNGDSTVNGRPAGGHGRDAVNDNSSSTASGNAESANAPAAPEAQPAQADRQNSAGSSGTSEGLGESSGSSKNDGTNASDAPSQQSDSSSPNGGNASDAQNGGEQAPQMPDNGNMQPPQDGQTPPSGENGEPPQPPQDGQTPPSGENGEPPQPPQDGQMPPMDENGGMPQMPENGGRPEPPQGGFGGRGGSGGPGGMQGQAPSGAQT